MKATMIQQKCNNQRGRQAKAAGLLDYMALILVN